MDSPVQSSRAERSGSVRKVTVQKNLRKLRPCRVVSLSLWGKALTLRMLSGHQGQRKGKVGRRSSFSTGLSVGDTVKSLFL